MYKRSKSSKPMSVLDISTHVERKQGLNVTPMPLAVGKLIQKHKFLSGLRRDIKHPRIQAVKNSASGEECGAATLPDGSETENSGSESSSFETDDSNCSSTTELAPCSSSENSDAEYSDVEILRKSNAEGNLKESIEDVSVSSIALAPTHLSTRTDLECDGLRTPTNKSIKIRSSMRKPQKLTKFSQEKVGKLQPKPSSFLLPHDESIEDAAVSSFNEELSGVDDTWEHCRKVSRQPTSTPLSGKDSPLKIDFGLSDIHSYTEIGDAHEPTFNRTQKTKREKDNHISSYPTCSLVRLTAPPPRPGIMFIKQHDSMRPPRRK